MTDDAIKNCHLYIRFKDYGEDARYFRYKAYITERAALDAARDLLSLYDWMDSRIKITESSHDSYFEIGK